VAGSVPMATATSMREPLRLPNCTAAIGCRWGRRRPHGAAGGLGHDAATRAASGSASALAAALRAGFAIVFGGDFLPLPVHAGGLAVVDLHAVHADVALAGFWVARVHAGQRDEGPPSCGQQVRTGKSSRLKLSRRMTSLQGRLWRLRPSWERPRQFAELREHLELVERPSGAFMFIRPWMRSAISSRLHAQSQAMRRSSRTG
jgi:hypothetical protein